MFGWCGCAERWDLADLRQHVGIVTQDVQLFAATVRDNLTLFQNYNEQAEPIPDGTIIAALESLGLGEWFRTLPDGLDTMLQGSQGLSAGRRSCLLLRGSFCGIRSW